MKTVSLSLVKIISLFVTSLLMILLMHPWFAWKIGRTNILMVAILILNFNYFRVSKKIFPYICLLQVIYLIYIIPDFNIKLLVNTYLLILFFYIEEKRCIDIFYFFKKMLAILLIPSIIIYILVMFFDLSFPYSLIEPSNKVKDFYYCNYFFFIEENVYTIMSRFNSYFDEPGTLGTFGGILLVADKYNLKNKYNVIIFIACILTFSFYFYILSLIYILLFSNNTDKLKYFVLLLCVILFLVSNEYFEPLTGRFLIEDGKLAGDNRTDQNFDIWYNNLFFSNDIWFGVGSDVVHLLFPGGCSYKYIIAGNGLIPFMLYCLAFTILAIKKISNKKSLFIWLLIFYSCLYQRPMISDYIYPIIWYISIYIIEYSNKNTYVLSKT